MFTMQNLSLNKIVFFQKYTVFATLLSIVFLMSSCSSTSEDNSDSTSGMSPQEIYNEAQGAMEDGKYDTAGDLFEKLESKFY